MNPHNELCRGTCIPKNWVKDGYEECADGSDEDTKGTKRNTYTLLQKYRNTRNLLETRVIIKRAFSTVAQWMGISACPMRKTAEIFSICLFFAFVKPLKIWTYLDNWGGGSATGGECKYECIAVDGINDYCQVYFEANGAYSGSIIGACTMAGILEEGFDVADHRTCRGTPRFCKDCEHKCTGRLGTNFTELVGIIQPSPPKTTIRPGNKYSIVASTNTCYYSENHIFCFLKSRILTCRIFFYLWR